MQKRNKPLKILCLPLGNYNLASSRTRVYEIFPKLSKKVFNAVICKGHFFNFNFGHYGRELEFILKSSFYDVLFVQKSISKKIFLCSKLMKLLGKKIIYDLDDPAYQSWQIVDDFISLSDLVLVENQFNKNHCKKINPKMIVEILLGPIDFAHYSKAKRLSGKKEVCIGWIGSAGTSKNIVFIVNALERIGKKFPDKVKFVIIGGTKERVNHEFENIKVEYKEWSLKSEISNLSKFDIGLMPLKDGIENRGKGGYKLLQYMSAGLPCIATDVGVNKMLLGAKKERGLLVDSNNNEVQWYNAFKTFIVGANLRKKTGAAGKKFVMKFDINSYCRDLEKILLENFKK
jgi:glycosyltransferase involved in cell wall biosynthesis